MKLFKNVFALAIVAIALFSCDDEAETIIKEVPVIGVSTDVTLTGSISGMELDASKAYKLEGIVAVTEGTLKIPAGTKIYGASGSSLVIGKGAKIEAQGTASNPVIFTSSKLKADRASGDWAGLVIVGNANTADAKSPVEGFPSSAGSLVEFGPSAVSAIDNEDNSGILSYVRIEYAGFELTPNNEINSLTLAGVGSKTQIDHIHIHAAKDDAVEIFGGSADVNYYVATQTQDDDVDLDDGYAGTMTYGIVWRNIKVTDQSGSSGLESGDKGTQAYTLKNFTFFGPALQASKDFGSINNGIQLKGTSNVTIEDCIIVGFPEATEGEKDGEFGTATKNTGLTFTGNVVVGGQADSNIGEASAQETVDATYAAADGYKTVFPASSASLETIGFSGFSSVATIVPAAGLTALAGKGATVGTEWNYEAGWILFDPTSVTY